jgi:hypothetical protein
MELDLSPNARPPATRYTRVVDLRRRASAGVILSRPGASLASLLCQACRFLSRRTNRSEGPAIVAVRDEDGPTLERLLQSAVRRLRSRGLSTSLLGVSLDAHLPGVATLAAVAHLLGVTVVLEVDAKERGHEAASRAELARAHRCVLLASGARDLDELGAAAAELGAQWASGGVLGGPHPTPRPFTQPQSALLDLALAMSRRRHDVGSDLLDTEVTLRALLRLAFLCPTTDLGGLLAGLDAGVYAARQRLASARTTTARAHASALAAGVHLTGLLDDVAAGRPPRGERLHAAIASYEEAAALYHCSASHEDEVERRARSLRASAELRIEALKEALERRGRSESRACA